MHQVRFLVDSVRSVVDQSYRNIELIIVDGLSSDGSQDIIVELQIQYPKKIRWVSLQDSGPAQALNTAIKMCNGDIIGWLNSDDLYNSSDIITLIVNHFQSDVDLDILYSDLVYVSKNNTNKILLIYSIDRFSRNLTKCNELLELIKQNNLILKSAKEEINLTTPLGRHTFRNYVSQAQFESEIISERIKNTLNYKKINTPKYGYYIKNDKMIINKEEQSINKFILNTYNQSLSSIKFTNHLFHLLNLLKKDKSEYINVEFLNNDKIIDINKPIKITSCILSNILNEYNILNRNKIWKDINIRNIYNEFNNLNQLTV